MVRAGFRAAAVIGCCIVIGGCGGPSTPRDQDVYHEASLRPGSVPADDEAERELLGRLPSLAAHEQLELGERQYVLLESYTSASGRRCTPVRVRGDGGDITRVACESDGAWVFVPDVFGGADPFAAGGP